MTKNKLLEKVRATQLLMCAEYVPIICKYPMG